MNVEERLRAALRPGADWPEPTPGFRERLLASLPSRQRRHSNWLPAVAAVVAIVAVSALAAAWSFQQRASGVPLPSTAATAAASATTTAAASASASAAAPTLVQASDWGMSFDYPVGWTLTDSNVNEHYITILGFVGSGSGSEICSSVTPPPGKSFPTGFTCGPVWDLPPGTVIIQFVKDEGLANHSPMTLGPQPGQAAVAVGGLPAYFARTGPSVPTSDETLSWTLSLPNTMGASYGLQAAIRGPNVARLEGQVRAMVDSIQYDPPLVPLPTGEAQAAAETSAVARAVVRLKAGADYLACFPTTPGATNNAMLTTMAGTRLKKPLPVRCSTTIQPTALQLWRLTLSYSWDAAADRTAGSSSIELYLTADGTSIGQITSFGPMPYQR